jgi:hypothetical protein
MSCGSKAKFGTKQGMRQKEGFLGPTLSALGMTEHGWRERRERRMRLQKKEPGGR